MILIPKVAAPRVENLSRLLNDVDYLSADRDELCEYIVELRAQLQVAEKWARYVRTNWPHLMELGKNEE